VKKLIIFAFAAVLALSIVSCKGSDEVIEPSDSTSEITTVTTTTVTTVTTVTTTATKSDWEPFENEHFIEVIEPKYDGVGYFSEGLAAAHNGKWGFIDKTGKEVIPFIYSSAYSFSEGVAWVSMESGYNAKYGLIDKTGKQILPFEYELSSSWWEYSLFSDKLAKVSDGKRTGEIGEQRRYVFIDKTGKRVTDSFHWAFPFSEGFAAVRFGHDDEEMESSETKYRYMDTNGKFISGETDPIMYWFFQDDGLRLHFSEGLAPFPKDGKYGFIDNTGKFVIEPKYDFVQGFSDGLSSFYDNGRNGYVDKTGKEVLVFDERGSLRAFSDGLASVFSYDSDLEDSYKVGYIDKTGKLVIPRIYEVEGGHGATAREFSEGLLAIGKMVEGYKDKKYGVIDTSGKEIIPFVYDCIEMFSEGMAAVCIGYPYGNNAKWGFIQIKD